MIEDDILKYTANFEWFNSFFDGLEQLLSAIGERLSGTIIPSGVKLIGTSFYFPTSSYKPTLPEYYVLMLKGEGFALQVYAALDLALLDQHPVFQREPSIIVVKHSHQDRAGSTDSYGLRVIRNGGIIDSSEKKGVFSGLLEKEKARFQSFQIPISEFITNGEIEDVIQQRIVEVLEALPDLK